jgi:hypothetical protein
VLQVLVPVPDYTAKCTILVTTGKAKYDATKKAIVSFVDAAVDTLVSYSTMPHGQAMYGQVGRRISRQLHRQLHLHQYSSCTASAAGIRG